MRALLLVFLLITSAATAETPQERREKIQAEERKPASAESLERKKRPIARLKQEGVRVAEHLPVIEDSKGVRIRASEEVARRAIAICITAVKGEGLEQATIDELVKRFQAESFFDGYVIPVDADEVAFKGFHSAHHLRVVPQVEGLRDPAILRELLGNPKDKYSYACRSPGA